MALPRRIIPGAIWFLTRRCTGRQFLLTPGPEINDAFVYCLAMAARRTRVRVLSATTMSNHHHTTVHDVEGRLPEFLAWFHKYVAKCGNALRGRWENFWSTEHTSCVRLVGPEDVLDKMVYAITNPVQKPVDRVDLWPGVNCLRAIEQDRPLKAKRPRFFRADSDMPEEVELHFERPPCFAHLSQQAWAKLLRDRVTEAEKKAAAERSKRGIRVQGRKAVLRQHWSQTPESYEPRRNLSPRVAARNKWARIAALQRDKAFQIAYKQARQAWLRGETVCFPAGTYWLRRYAGVPCAPCPPPD